MNIPSNEDCMPDRLSIFHVTRVGFAAAKCDLRVNVRDACSELKSLHLISFLQRESTKHDVNNSTINSEN